MSDILDFVIILLFLPVGRLFNLPLDEIRFQIRFHNNAEEIYEANKLIKLQYCFSVLNSILHLICDF